MKRIILTIAIFGLLFNVAIASTVFTIRFAGTVNPGSADFIDWAIKKAVISGSECLLIEMDTPGGLVSSTRTIVQSLLNAPLPIVVYVSPAGAHAGSAGVMITLAAHIAAMAPGTNIGAAHPVAMGEEKIDEELKKKITNDTVAFVKAIAQKRKRNVDWAIKAVEESASVTANEALALKVIDLLADNVNDLLAKIDGKKVELNGKAVELKTKDAKIVVLEPSIKHKLLMTLADPNLAYILLLIGIIGLYVEFSHPGLIFPGVVGALSLILFLISIQTLPINYGGLILILLAIVLFVLEMKIASYGLLTIGGIICFVLGALFMFDAPEKVFDAKSFSFSVSKTLVFPTAVALGGFIGLVTLLVVKARLKKPYTGIEGLIGAIGEVRTKIELNKKGLVFVHGEYWQATSDEPIEEGSQIEVVGYDGLVLKVKRARQ